MINEYLNNLMRNSIQYAADSGAGGGKGRVGAPDRDLRRRDPTVPNQNRYSRGEISAQGLLGDAAYEAIMRQPALVQPRSE